MTKEPKLRVTASELLTAAVFQIQDTKEAAARGNAIANEKLNLLLQQNQAIQTALNSFLPAIQKNLNLLISDAKLPPGKFVILPIKNSFNLTNKFYKKYKLNFICEVEGGYHLVEAKEFGYEMKEFSKLSKGLILGSQILLSLAVAALVPAAGSLVNGAATGIIDILQAASEEVSSEIQSWKLSSSEYSEIEKDSSDAMMEFIKVFLEKNGNSRLGVKKANRVDGTIAWLCEKHYKNEDITVQSYNDSQDRPTADMTANANGDIGDSTAGVIKSEPVLPDKLASPKAVNQSLLDFWDSSETSVKWEEFFSMVIVEMKINKNTCQLDKTSLREACGDFSQALPSLKFSLLKKVVGSEDVKDFFDRYIVNKNEVKTVEWYIKDAERGNLGSQVKLGERYSTGIGVEKNLGKSFFWYLKAAEQGSAISQDQVAICYSSGLGVDKDEKVAFSWFSKAAHQGNSNSQFKLSTCYKYGLGVASDEANSIYWLKKAVERGNSYAQFHLGERYAQGLGVSKDEKRAFELYWKAADQNNSYAQFNLGEIYASGKGVAKDEKRAFELYWKAADQNNSYAQFNLGEIYENGKGVPKDEKRAVKLYTKAGDQNNSYALYNLGECYAHGKGVTKDEQKAIELFMKSAALESSYAQFNLGVRFFHGNGVQQDKEQSKEFLQKALANGHHRAQEILDKF